MDKDNILCLVFIGDAPIDRDATLHRQAQSMMLWMRQH